MSTFARRVGNGNGAKWRPASATSSDRQPSLREAAFKAARQLKSMDQENQLAQAVAAVMGRDAKRLWLDNRPAKIAHYRKQGLPLLRDPAGGAGDARKFPRLPRHGLARPEAWNTLLSALARRGLADESFKVYRKVN